MPDQNLSGAKGAFLYPSTIKDPVSQKIGTNSEILTYIDGQ